MLHPLIDSLSIMQNKEIYTKNRQIDEIISIAFSELYCLNEYNCCLHSNNRVQKMPFQILYVGCFAKQLNYRDKTKVLNITYIVFPNEGSNTKSYVL